MATVSELVSRLALTPHPEGGFFKETYRSELTVRPKGFPSERNISTGIYFLLRACDFSAFHRIRSDEMWHYYSGEPLEVIMLNEKGRSGFVLGPDIQNGQCFQNVVPAGSWFASRLLNYDPSDEERYCLAGCTVSPGFDFQDFEMPGQSEMLSMFPDHREIILELTRNL